MAASQGNGVSGHGEVFLGCGGLGGLLGHFLELFNLGGGGLLEFVQFLAVFAFEFGGHGAEFFHEGRDLTFFAQETDAGFFHLFLGGGFQIVQFT